MQIIATNRKAKFEYFTEKKYEAGIVLKGEEIKSIRNHGINIQEAYITDIKGELFLVNAHVSKYKYSYNPTYDPTRSKKLLLHKNQIIKIISLANQKSYTCIALLAYLTRGMLKITVGVCKGKKLYDKRKSLKEKTIKRDRRYE